MRPGEQKSLDRFLLLLDADRERAGVRYENLRRALLRFFSSNGSTEPETRADEVIDILIRQTMEEREIRELETYALGVARNVLLKEIERRKRGPAQLDTSDSNERLTVVPAQEDKTEVTEEEVRKCQRECLSNLAPEERSLIERYHSAVGHDKKNRDRLAVQLELSPVALRVKAHRIRKNLKACVQKCLQGVK